MNIKNGILVVTLLSLLTTACKKDDTDDTANQAFTSAEDNSMMETEFSAIFDVVEDIATEDTQVFKKSGSILPGGATITFSDTTFFDGDGVEFCVSYGELGSSAPKGMLCKDGRYRAGSFCVSVDQRFREVGAEATVTITDGNNYYSGDGSDMTKFVGTKTILKIEDDKYQIVVNGATAENPKYKVIWSSNYTIQKTLDVPGGILGDEYTIEGKADGTNREGELYTVTITSPLRKVIQIGCASTFVEGNLEVINTTSGNRLAIDYDPFNNQECDKVVQVKVNGKAFQFIVR